MDLIWILMYTPTMVSILAIGVWVAVDQAAEARRRAAEARHEPVVIDTSGRLVAVGVAPVPPRSHRAQGRWSR